ncbi:MAG TPA: alpha/beta hydrolase [Terriglobia bacterium]|nr:alpha/beta hydrolase [Terriglobia bacterium]
MNLALERIEGSHPDRSIAFLHGILGSGRNLQTVARRFVAEHPHWTAWLVDLRGHGRSPKGTAGASLGAAAQDVSETAAAQGPPLAGIAGHSFGGKVALEVARQNTIPSLKRVIVIDSMPGSREPLQGADSALSILKLLESLPDTFPSITEFVAALENAGITRPVAQWLAGSLERRSDSVRFGLDHREIRALMLDYFARDLWPVVENPPGEVQIHLVIGEQSDSYSSSDRERAQRIAVVNPRVKVTLLPAGHWVHVDDPDGLLAAMSDLEV